MKRNAYYILFSVFFIAAFLSALNAQTKTLVAQTETVEFPKNGTVKAEIVETIGKPIRIVFTSEKTKKRAAEFVLKNGDRYIPFDFNSAVNPIARFRVLENIEGLPQPLIQAVAVNPGGSDHAFWTILFAEIDGKIKMITPKTTENAIQGGVHFGNLGEGNGVGMAVYNFIWDDAEAHYDGHRYKVDLYKFDESKGTLQKTETLVSKEKYEKKSDALKELGFGFFTNRLNDFEAITDFRADDNEFSETPETNPETAF